MPVAPDRKYTFHLAGEPPLTVDDVFQRVAAAFPGYELHDAREELPASDLHGKPRTS